jgi:hypothetical protein
VSSAAENTAQGDPKITLHPMRTNSIARLGGIPWLANAARDPLDSRSAGGALVRRRSFLLFATAFLLGTPALADSIYSVDVNTAPLAGTPAQIAFDFIAGGGPSNTVTVTDFSSDGTLGATSPTGAVKGTLPGAVTLTDSSFFNEYLTNFTPGTTFSFRLSATTNGPTSTSLPDEFSLFLLDPTTGMPLFNTSDPTGADSLLALNIDGSPQGALSLYTASGNQATISATPLTVSTVPEPRTLVPLAVAILAVIGKTARRSIRR